MDSRFASLAIIDAAQRVAHYGAWRRFRYAATHLEQAQAARLQALLTRNAHTAYGKAHNLGQCTSIEDFQRRVPVVDYDDLEPWIQQIARGDPNILTAERVRMLERSSGSSSGNKLIPYTKSLLRDFSAATGPWLFSLLATHPRLMGTQSYWSISPVKREKKTSEGGLPIGFEDDTEYFPRWIGWALRLKMAVPASVAHAKNMETWRWETTRHLLNSRDLGLISVWSPTFLSVLMQYIADNLDALLATCHRGRAEEIKRGLDGQGTITGRALWPRLQLVSCWTDGSAAGFLAPMRAWFPGTEIQGKGLLATEGVVSFPLGGTASHRSFDAAPVLAVSGHFLEFLDCEKPNAKPLLAHELKWGGRYSPLLTTGGGFVRYRLEDEVVCVGNYGKVPRVRFAGKLDKTSDLCGEKLTPAQVDTALAAVSRCTGVQNDFALLAPVQGTPSRYHLYLQTKASETKVASFAAALEEELKTSYHYKYCRDLRQLDAVTACRVQDGWRKYESALRRQGMRAGDIKPTSLDTRPIWADVFADG